MCENESQFCIAHFRGLVLRSVKKRFLFVYFMYFLYTFVYRPVPKAALRRDAVTPSCSVRGQPEGKPVRLSAVAAGESVAIWKRFENDAGGKVSLPI